MFSELRTEDLNSGAILMHSLSLLPVVSHPQFANLFLVLWFLEIEWMVNGQDFVWFNNIMKGGF